MFNYNPNFKSTSKCIPQNDLDCFYNTKWKRLHKIVNNKSEISNFSIIQDKINNFFLI